MRNRLFLIVLLALLPAAAPHLAAQEAASAVAPTPTWSLSWDHGVGFARFREPLSSPITYRGPALLNAFGVERRVGHWTVSFAQRLLPAVHAPRTASLLSLSAVGLDLETELLAHRDVWHNDRWRFDLGAGIANWAGIRYNAQHENTSVGVTDAVQLMLEAGVECALFRRLSALLDVRFSPVALAARPGFTYMDNYTAGNDVASTVGRDYRFGPSAWPLTHVEWGLAYRAAGGNRVELTYRWRFVDIGLSGSQPLEGASHLVLLRFKFALA